MEGIFAPGLFAGKVVVVTGAAGGVGGAVARLLTSLGAQVVATDLPGPKLEAVPAALHYAADLREVAGCAGVIATALAACGRIDAVVNAAGVGSRGRRNRRRRKTGRAAST